MSAPQQHEEPPPGEQPAENVVPFRRPSKAGPSKAGPAKAAPQADPTPRPAPMASDDDRARNRTNVAVLVLAAVLVFLGWLLVHELGRSAKMQDCLMSGRTNCNPIPVPPRE